MKPVVAGAVGVGVFLLLLLLGAGLVAATHVPTIGHLLGLFGVAIGAFVATRLAAGRAERRGVAGLAVPLVGVLSQVVLAARAGALDVRMLPFLVVTLLAGAFGTVVALQGAADR